MPPIFATIYVDKNGGGFVFSFCKIFTNLIFKEGHSMAGYAYIWEGSSAFGQNRIMVKAALVKKVQNFLPYKVQRMNYKSEGLWSRNT